MWGATGVTGARWAELRHHFGAAGGLRDGPKPVEAKAKSPIRPGYRQIASPTSEATASSVGAGLCQVMTLVY